MMKSSRHALSMISAIGIGVAFAWLFQPAIVTAYTRMPRPLAVSVAQADSIIVARIIRAPDSPSTTEIAFELEASAVLKGTLSDGALTAYMNRPHYVYDFGRASFDRNYIFFLQAKKTTSVGPEIMPDGTCPYTAESAAEIKALIALTPAWSPPQDGLSTIIIAEKYRLTSKEDLTLFVGYRNVSEQRITLKHSDWPLATHTYWELDIAPERGVWIAAARHPHLTQDEIDDYFSRFAHSYEITLEPGEEHFFGLNRVNTAQAGWGYKEELNFKFYPMTQAGVYEISARSKNIRGTDMVSKGLRVWIE